jgi:uncharacterized protein YndB with AHSA1/START domain
MAKNSAEGISQELVITRIIDAPRDVVFKAWLDEKQLAQWWGPKDFTNPVCRLDVRPGGNIQIDMRAPDGTVYPMGGTFKEIMEPLRLVFISTAMVDEAGSPQLENLNTITFEEHNGKTKLTLHVRVLKATAAAKQALDGMEQGWSQSLDRLAQLAA